MASAETQKTTCPVCNQADQVKSMQAAYESGVERCAPPDMPTKRVPMLPYIIFSAVIVGVCIFLVLVFVGGFESNLPVLAQYILLGITLICIISALVISYYAFQRVVKGDNQMTVRFPAWDRAMTTWRNLRYCARDNVVFEQNSHKVWSEEQLAALRAMDEGAPEVRSAAIAGQ